MHAEMAAYRTVFREGLFAGRVVVVTGGGSGIGRCTAHELAALGARVVLIGRKPERLLAVAAEITADAKACDQNACASGSGKGCMKPTEPLAATVSISSADSASRSASVTGAMRKSSLPLDRRGRLSTDVVDNA